MNEEELRELGAALAADAAAVAAEYFTDAIDAVAYAIVLFEQHRPPGADYAMPEKAMLALTEQIWQTALQISPALAHSNTITALDIAYRMGAADARLQILGNAEVRDNDNET